MDISRALMASGAFKVRTAIQTSKPFTFTGGVNVMDSPMNIPPGELYGVSNFEPGIVGGYRRVDGYERFDGHASPSDAPYVSLGYASSGGFTPAAGATVTESGSGASGTVAYLDTANDVVVLVATSGTFAGAGSTLTSGAQTATSVGTPLANSGKTQALSDTYYYQKWLYLQALIGPVGGSNCSGPARAAWPYNATVYAFRDNAAGTAGTMWQATSTGWQQVALGIKVYYTAGIYTDGAQDPMPEGTVLTGATSGATMTVKRVITKTGTWSLDAAGFFIVASITGTPVAGELLKNGTTTYCTYQSNAAQALPVGGTYHFRNHNFNAAQNPSTGYRMYGVNGVGNGFEYDSASNTFVLIETGMATDTPTHIEVHADYLFFGFSGGSLQNSGYQQPLNWQVVTGADERSVGAPITFMREDVSQTLVVGTRKQLWTLTGLQVEQFQVQVYASNTGAIAGTDEMPGQIIFGEDRGITTVAAAAQYGNFEATSLSNKILKLINPLLTQGAPVGAIVTRKKNLYRLFFSNGAVFSLAINAAGQFTGWSIANLLAVPEAVSCGFTQQTGAPQVERAFFCTSTGYVMEVDKGRSFDGQVVTFFMKAAYWHLGSPGNFKRFRRIQLDVQPEGSASIYLGADCDYGARTGMTNPQTALQSGGGLWDVALWDQFTWDAPTYQGLAMKLELEGYNISPIISGSAVNDTPFTVTGAQYQYTARIINRNSQEA